MPPRWGDPFVTGSIHLEVLSSMEERSFNVSLFSLHNNMLIIFEKNNLINKCNFRFTNIKVVKTIKLAMKSSIEISLRCTLNIEMYTKITPILFLFFKYLFLLNMILSLCFVNFAKKVFIINNNSSTLIKKKPFSYSNESISICSFNNLIFIHARITAVNISKWIIDPVTFFFLWRRGNLFPLI